MCLLLSTGTLAQAALELVASVRLENLGAAVRSISLELPQLDVEMLIRAVALNLPDVSCFNRGVKPVSVRKI